MTINCMVDLETLGRKSGAAILSIGAVIFDDKKDILGKSFYAKIAEPRGSVDMSTIMWWLRQSIEAKDVFTVKDAMSHEEALAAFYKFYTDQKAARLWCYGAGFDEPILRGAVNGPPVPWNYSDVRCARTLYSLAGVQLTFDDKKHHNALEDAVQQAKAALLALKRIAR